MIRITFAHVLVDCVDLDEETLSFCGCTRLQLGYTRVGGLDFDSGQIAVN